MTRFLNSLLLMAAFSIAPVVQALAEEVEGGILNPEEMTISYYANNLSHVKKRHNYVCWFAYEAHKSGNHPLAHKIFNTCAEGGHHASMMFMSHLHDNGYGVKKDAVKATDWLKRAAEDGYSVGEFNYGVALLRGHGTTKDVGAGKSYISRAAGQGDSSAHELIGAGYDLDVVTPDAEEPDKAPMY